MIVSKSVQGTLVFFCGKMGAGKSTLSEKLAMERSAVLLAEDEWLASLYPDKIKTLRDYSKYSSLLKPQIKKLTKSLLVAGTDVVMDYPANTREQREWFKEIFTEAAAPHELIYLDASNDICLERIAERREQLGRPTDTREMFEQVTKHFAPPSKEEGFTMQRIVANAGGLN